MGTVFPYETSEISKFRVNISAPAYPTPTKFQIVPYFPAHMMQFFSRKM
jgi:hypothetical protein